MKLSVSKPYEDWSQFLKPNIPIVPVIGYSQFFVQHSTNKKIDSVFFQGRPIYSHSGRYALSAALDIMEIGSNDSVLIPSYHCLSMVAPIVYTGAEPCFYKLNDDLTFNIEDIEDKISAATKAIIVVHFFGFPQRLSELVQLCKKYKIQLIEDCAHAFFGYTGSEQIGSTGDFAIASLKKFFPVMDGGMLISNRHLNEKLIQTPLKIKQQLKYIINSFENSIFYNRLKLLKFIGNILEYIKKLNINVKIKPKCTDLKENLSDELRIQAWFDPAQKANKISYISKLIINYSDIDKICNKRRKNYLYLLEKLNDLKSVEPLYPKLKPGVIPYMFPLILKNPETDFKKLKMKKIPIWRWEELCISDCEISRYYSKHLIQLPCHQSLRKRELDAIIHAVKGL